MFLMHWLLALLVHQDSSEIYESSAALRAYNKSYALPGVEGTCAPARGGAFGKTCPVQGPPPGARAAVRAGHRIILGPGPRIDPIRKSHWNGGL